MYPAGQLTEIASRKAALRSRIATRRLECVAYAAEVARPIAWIDRAAAQWRKISPYAKLAIVPLASLLLRRKTAARNRTPGWGRWLKLMPIVASAARMWGKLRR